MATADDRAACISEDVRGTTNKAGQAKIVRARIACEWCRQVTSDLSRDLGYAKATACRMDDNAAPQVSVYGESARLCCTVPDGVKATIVDQMQSSLEEVRADL